jgi:hypothetical protein
LKKKPRTAKPRCAKLRTYGENGVRGNKDTRIIKTLHKQLIKDKHENTRVGVYWLKVVRVREHKVEKHY